MQSGGLQAPWFSQGAGLPPNPLPAGFIHTDTAGRTDTIPATVPADSYIIPADIVSGIGQGNSLAGAKLLDQAFGIYGLMPGSVGSGFISPRSGVYAKGGRTKRAIAPAPADIIVAGGEYVIPPNVVTAIGDGDVKAGHRKLDDMVNRVRAHTIKRTKNLKGPKK